MASLVVRGYDLGGRARFWRLLRKDWLTATRGYRILLVAANVAGVLFVKIYGDASFWQPKAVSVARAVYR